VVIRDAFEASMIEKELNKKLAVENRKID